MSEQTVQFRNVYTCEEFVTEVLCGKRTVDWCRGQIKAKKIKVVGRKPYLIPRSEAERFVYAK